jgi:hypothetical protein
VPFARSALTDCELSRINRHHFCSDPQKRNVPRF